LWPPTVTLTSSPASPFLLFLLSFRSSYKYTLLWIGRSSHSRLLLVIARTCRHTYGVAAPRTNKHSDSFTRWSRGAQRHLFDCLASFASSLAIEAFAGTEHLCLLEPPLFACRVRCQGHRASERASKHLQCGVAGRELNSTPLKCHARYFVQTRLIVAARVRGVSWDQSEKSESSTLYPKANGNASSRLQHKYKGCSLQLSNIATVFNLFLHMDFKRYFQRLRNFLSRLASHCPFHLPQAERRQKGSAEMILLLFRFCFFFDPHPEPI
jgi:hypothetical protein